MFPINDDIPTTRPTPVHYAFIAGCVLVFLWQTFGAAQPGRFVLDFGVMPAGLFDQLYGGPVSAAEPWITLFTSQFLHGGWMHLIGNMMFLYIFGNNVEEAFGSVWFTLFYLACGCVAALAQAAANTQSIVPIIGASGAISGVLGAYLVLFPRARVLTLFFVGIVTVFRVPAIWFLLGWLGFQTLNAAASFSTVGEGGGVAFLAHVGGFVAGAGAAFVFKLWLRKPAGPWG